MDPQTANSDTSPDLVVQSTPPPKPKSKSPLLLMLLIVALLLVGGGYYLGLQQKTAVTINPSPTSDVIITPDLTADWKTYTNAKSDFSFKYPEEWATSWKKNSYSDSDIYFLDLPDGYLEPLHTFSVKVFDIPANKSLNAFILNGGMGESYGASFWTASIPLELRKTNDHTDYSTYNPGEWPSVNGILIRFIVNTNGTKVAWISIEPPDDRKYETIFSQILSTFKFTSVSTSPSTTSSPQSLSYQLTTGWNTTQDNGGNFEVGYNPANYNPIVQSSDKYILLGDKNHPGSIGLTLVSYNGGSRHQFIYDQLGYSQSDVNQNKKDNYYEKEYIVSGKSCLILYGLGYSASGIVWGMCTMSPTQAIYFAGLPTVTENEQFIQSFKLLR